MRDRLVELLDNATVEKTKCYPNGIPAIMYCEKAVSRQVVYQLADYLLENGVIVPPCKVGDVVYFYKAEINEICPAKVITIKNNYYTPSMPLWITIEYESKLIGKQSCEMTSDVFKLLCHTKREEAEQALKGGAE